MRLQEVLKERESEITALESSLKESREEHSPAYSPASESGSAPKANGIKPHPDVTLSPQTMNQFDRIRMTMENGNGHAINGHFDSGSDKAMASMPPETDESLERLNELMLYVCFI